MSVHITATREAKTKSRENNKYSEGMSLVRSPPMKSPGKGTYRRLTWTYQNMSYCRRDDNILDLFGLIACVFRLIITS